jgi:hypothetical protein
MWQAQMRRAEAVVGWPTDGIPTVRPNLGTVFLPSLMGLSYHVRPDQMPWPGPPLTREAIRKNRDVDVAQAELMKRAEAFYRLHRRSGADGIALYLPDTQGVFDVAHLLYGDALFYELADEEPGWVEELMGICLGLYVRASQYLKGVIGEKQDSMVHGYTTAQGVPFPHAGVRVCEDTATLLSPQMIERFVIPYVERSVEPFGGGFVHFCGRHPFFFERLCRCELIRAVDLGNPEMYDSRWLLERCAQTETVLYSRLASEPGEDWRGYVQRVARMVRETGARCILRPMLFPATRKESADMLYLWHDLTSA